MKQEFRIDNEKIRSNIPTFPVFPNCNSRELHGLKPWIDRSENGMQTKSVFFSSNQ